MLKFMRVSVTKMSFFLFYIIRSTLQHRDFCVHSCVTWYEETHAERAVFRFSKKICKTLKCDGTPKCDGHANVRCFALKCDGVTR